MRERGITSRRTPKPQAASPSPLRRRASRFPSFSFLFFSSLGVEHLCPHVIGSGSPFLSLLFTSRLYILFGITSSSPLFSTSFLPAKMSQTLRVVPIATQTAAVESSPLETMAASKPQCGGGEEVGEYDVPLHVAGLCTLIVQERSLRSLKLNMLMDAMPLIVVVLFASIIGRKPKWPLRPGSHAGTFANTSTTV